MRGLSPATTSSLSRPSARNPIPTLPFTVALASNLYRSRPASTSSLALDLNPEATESLCLVRVSTTPSRNRCHFNSFVAAWCKPDLSQIPIPPSAFSAPTDSYVTVFFSFGLGILTSPPQYHSAFLRQPDLHLGPIAQTSTPHRKQASSARSLSYGGKRR